MTPRWKGSAAPLSDSYREHPLWWDDAEFPATSARPLPAEADVVVIGAGYTGAAAALELQKRGREALVLDKARLGRGASGRNGGMVHAGLRRDGERLQRRYGPRGRALHDASVDAHRLVARIAAEVAPDACHAPRGWLYLAHSQRQMGRLAQRAESRRRAGECVQLLDRDALADETSARGFHGGLLTDNGAEIHPARYLAGLQRAAIDSGATFVDRTAARTVVQSAGGFNVHTDQGVVAARDVLVATDGYTDRAFPQLRRRVIPIGSYVIATEPLDAEQVSLVSSARRMMSDTRNFLHYWRLSHDGRLVFGGRTSFAPIRLRRARDQLYAAMVRMYPHLDGVRVSHAWRGTVGFTFDQLPHMGRIDGVAYALGYCGSGIAMASWFGTVAGVWLAAGEGNPFLDLRFRTLAGYTGTPWFLPAVGWWYQLRDAVR